MPSKYSEEFRSKAVRLVVDHRDDYGSEFEAITTIARRLGVSPESVRRWIRQAAIDEGRSAGVSSAERAEIRELKRKNAELERTVDILKAATKFLRAGARPATALICQFITEHRARWGVEPICRVLSEHGCTIAPRTYYAHLRRPPSRRALADAVVAARIAKARTPDGKGRTAPESLYGAVKTQAWLNRTRAEGEPLVARCTVERLMRAHGWAGATRKRKFRTTIPDPSHARAADLVHRNFVVPAPNRLVVADFTDTPLASGTKAYTAFVIDAFAGTITGWECSTSKATAFIERALRQAGQFRRNQGNPLQGNTIHHSDAGSQYTSIHFGEALLLEGLVPSIGTVADAYDNALAETTIGLFKTECYRRGSPFLPRQPRTLAELEDAVAAWVHWYNTDRLMHRLGLIPPLECEAAYYAAERATKPASALTTECASKSG
ncbi:MAG: IS3 family transposase [Candidatus Nanopelagicales bacterium]